jgi:hypothetical protein
MNFEFIKLFPADTHTIPMPSAGLKFLGKIGHESVEARNVKI